MNGIQLRELRKARGLTQDQLSRATGIPQGSIARIESKGEDIKKVDQLRLINDFFKIEENLLQEPGAVYLKSKQKSTFSGTPVYTDSRYVEPAYVVDIPQIRDCDFGKIVNDPAMKPGIPVGSVIFCKTVPDKNVIVYGQVYYIEFDNYSLVRRLQKAKKDTEVLAVADNEEKNVDGIRRYQNFEIPIDKVKSMYIAKGLFSIT